MTRREAHSVRPISDDIPIVQIVPSQRVEMEYHAHLGRVATTQRGTPPMSPY